MGGLSKVLGSVGAAAGLTSVAGVVGLDSALNIGSMLYQNKENKKAATTAYNREVALMDKQNAYNTPAEQMARYKAAGLNPNLIYGQQNLSASASSVPQQHASVSPKFNLAAGLKLGQDLQLGQEQIKQVDASKRLLAAQIKKVNAETAILKHELDITPDGISTKDHSGIGQGAKIIKAIDKKLDAMERETKAHSYNPDLPALGRNYKQ